MSDTPRAQRQRHRSPNGTVRPYKDHDRWIAPGYLTTPQGAQRLVRGTGKTREQAVARLKTNMTKAEAQYQIETLPRPDLATVGGWTQHWLTSIKSGTIKYRTTVGYQAAIDRWITPHLGQTPLVRLTLEDIEHLHARIEAAGHSRSVWVQVRTVLKQSLDAAVKRGHVPSNPVLQAPQPRKAARSRGYLTAEQAGQVLCGCESPRDKARWALALGMGLRQGEALALRWSDLDLDSTTPVIRITRSVWRETGRGLVVGDTKTERSRRTLQMPAEYVSYLKATRTSQKEACLAAGTVWNVQFYVFGTTNGTPLDPSRDRRRWLAALKRASIPQVRLHDARHSAASMMIGIGIDIAIVSSALGHASISTTADIYGHVPGNSVGSALASVAGAIAF